jgi:hypothetical protein
MGGKANRVSIESKQWWKKFTVGARAKNKVGRSARVLERSTDWIPATPITFIEGTPICPPELAGLQLWGVAADDASHSVW